MDNSYYSFKTGSYDLYFGKVIRPDYNGLVVSILNKSHEFYYETHFNNEYKFHKDFIGKLLYG